MYDDSLLVKIPKEIKEKVKNKAKENCQTASDYIRGLIVKDLKENEN